MTGARSRTRWVSFAVAVLNCLVVGSIAVFALYAPQLQSHLKYTSLQVNAIGIACQLGLYLSVPFMGFACDNRGPRICSIYAAAVFLPAYLVAGLAYERRWPPWVLVVCYASLGSATVALYMAGLSTVAKNHPNARGLSMAVVTASFGLSGLWETQVVDHFYRSNETGEINIRAMYTSFGILLSLVSVLSAIALRVVDSPATHRRHQAASEEALDSEEDEDDEYTALLSQSALLEPSDKLSQTDRMKIFLRDHSSWWYFLAFILLAGPGEVFTINLGSIFQSLLDDARALGPGTGMRIGAAGGEGASITSASSQVSLFALSSTLGRLVFGALCDVPSKSPITARMVVLILTASLLTFGFTFLSYAATTTTFWVAAVSIGAGYGGLFTVYPAIISIVWGTENFATFWGCLATAPAVGSTVFGILYAKSYDRASEHQQDGGGGGGLCRGRGCFESSTLWFALSNLVGVGILLFATVVWRRRFSGGN